MVKLIEKNCIDCGQTFIAHGHSALRCEECKEKITRIRRRENMRKKRKGVRLYPAQPAKTIYEIERERRIYNQEHGTNLSYGQYVLKVEGRQPDGKKKR